MALHISSLARRAAVASQSPASQGLNQTMTTLLAVLVVLLITAIALTGVLYVLRQRRKARRKIEDVPMVKQSRLSSCSIHSNHRRTSAQPSQSIHVFREKQFFEEMSDAPPTNSTLPEIRITFPEEVDSAGKRQSGRVVVVHVGDSSVSFEGVSNTLPSYQQSEGDRFQSIDLERIGGLEEKAPRKPLGWC